MEDTIYREDATAPLKTVILHGAKDKDGTHPISAELVFSHLVSLPSAGRPQGWIPCKERLPREYEVLCCDIYKSCIVGHPFADDSVSTGFCAESEGEFMYECVAWMPLPLAYRGE